MWYKNVDEIFEKLQTCKDGLTNTEVKKRLSEKGLNKIPTSKKNTIFNMIIEQLRNPIIFILIFAAIFSIITQSEADAIFIFVVIGINTIIGTYQEWSSEKSAEKLQNMIKIKTKVLRNGKIEEVDSENIVIGDIIELESGNKVPADLRLIEAKNLSIDESILTGESKPKNKSNIVLSKETELAERDNIAFAGCVVVKGRGRGIAIATGQDTEFGKVAENVLHSKGSKTPLVIKIEKFSRQISIAFFIFAIFISAVLYFKGYELPEILSIAIALTVSAIPEGLTIAMTIVLSVSSSQMAKKHVIVKKLNAVESLGSCNVIATDKTGTLTANEQTAKKIIFPNDSVVSIKGIGYNDIGEIRCDSCEKDKTEEIIKMGYINNEARLEYNGKCWKHSGDAIDTAFLALGMKVPIKIRPNIKSMIHYESHLKYSAVVFEENGEYYVTAKGAPEKILTFCKYMNNKDRVNKEKILNQNIHLAEEGYRVIAIANGKISKRNFELNGLEEKDIKDLTFLGLVGFVDPIREGVQEAIESCKKAGIETIMITGDQKNTAETIAKRIGIKKVYSRVTPMEKLEIVQKLKAEGKMVAVTGDGVNDTPALKSANIGVAIGSGTDIAKETGDMIITDDNFSSIVNGVEEGRKAYNNIRKVIYLLLSTGLSEIILFVLAILFNLPIPLIAIQLLWLNLISNGIQSNALAFEKDIENVMDRPANNQKIFDKLMVNEIIISAFTMGIIEFVFYLYLYNIKKMEITIVRSYLLTLMVLIENIHIFNCRSERISAFKISGQNNKFLIFSILLTCIIQIIVVRSNTLSNILHLSTIPLEFAGVLSLFSIPLIIIMEIYKKYKKIIDN